MLLYVTIFNLGSVKIHRAFKGSRLVIKQGVKTGTNIGKGYVKYIIQLARISKK